jgi:hypothetical protein
MSEEEFAVAKEELRAKFFGKVMSDDAMARAFTTKDIQVQVR